MSNKMREILLRPVFNENPIALQILGICSALAVTSSLKVTSVMCICLIVVAAVSSMSGLLDKKPNSREHKNNSPNDRHRFSCYPC